MHTIDLLPLWGILLILVLSMVSFIEIGYWIGQRPKSKKNKAQLSQVRAIMGASLGLVAFMLAFSFSMAQTHFETRVGAYFLEISAIDSSHRGADLLDGNSPEIAKDLLMQFARLRLDTADQVESGHLERVREMIRESEHMHDQLWRLAESSMASAGDGVNTGIFAQSVLAMINAHDARLQAAMFNRISPIIWGTLYVMALMAMLIMGYHAGLTQARSNLATWTLALTFSVVMALVTDLDRPNMTLFKMNQDLLVELVGRMDNE